MEKVYNIEFEKTHFVNHIIETYNILFFNIDGNGWAEWELINLKNNKCSAKGSINFKTNFCHIQENKYNDVVIDDAWETPDIILEQLIEDRQIQLC